ncbi:hypothetical protein DLAC_11572 [Tieghemostelium lacteum]|uniref:Transmembrane protein n=1 Tax=Tieghemostelium lacteum TaxID=361077 RepID=A0A151ZS31_TIELA|nr:hypothetical protein DLAC_11572 [Tieghemostelium lacteum]|eukprot:KYQ96756.1 hypothetical protein DLAC_11572 [Tieghemostelium lacteum]
MKKQILVIFTIGFLIGVSLGDYVNQYLYKASGLKSECSNEVTDVVSFQTGACTEQGFIYQCDYENQLLLQMVYNDTTCEFFLYNNTFEWNTCNLFTTLNCSQKLDIQPQTTTTYLYGDCSQTTDPVYAHTNFLGMCAEPYAVFGENWIQRECNSTYLTVNYYKDPNQPSSFSSSSGTVSSIFSSLSSGSGFTGGGNDGSDGTSGSASKTTATSGRNDFTTGADTEPIVSASGSTGSTSANSGSQTSGSQTSGSQTSGSSFEYSIPQCYDQYLVYSNYIQLSTPSCSNGVEFTQCN